MNFVILTICSPLVLRNVAVSKFQMTHQYVLHYFVQRWRASVGNVWSMNNSVQTLLLASNSRKIVSRSSNCSTVSIMAPGRPPAKSHHLNKSTSNGAEAVAVDIVVMRMRLDNSKKCTRNSKPKKSVDILFVETVHSPQHNKEETNKEMSNDNDNPRSASTVHVHVHVLYPFRACKYSLIDGSVICLVIICLHSLLLVICLIEASRNSRK